MRALHDQVCIKIKLMVRDARRWSLALFQVGKLQQYFTHNAYDTLVLPRRLLRAVYMYKYKWYDGASARRC